MLNKKSLLIISLLFLTIGCKNNNVNDILNNRYHRHQQKNIVYQKKSFIKKTNNKQIINNNDQTLLNKYNSLVNYHQSYHQQLTNCQTLIKEIKQIINETNNNQYQSLITKIKHKQQWLTNNHLGFDYWLIGIMQIIFAYLPAENVFIEKIFTFNGKERKIFVLPFIYFLLLFLFNSINNFEDLLANNIHSLFTKYAFNNNDSLPKHQACYFYYDHSTKMIINNEKYFTIPLLLVNNNHFITDFMNLLNDSMVLNILIFSLIKYFMFDRKVRNCRYVRTLIFTFTFIKFFSIINILLIHLLGENNALNQFKLAITYSFKSLPIINKFYYQPKHNIFKHKIFNHLISISSITILITINYHIAKSHNIRVFLETLRDKREAKIINKIITDEEIKKILTTKEDDFDLKDSKQIEQDLTTLIEYENKKINVFNNLLIKDIFVEKKCYLKKLKQLNKAKFYQKKINIEDIDFTLLPSFSEKEKKLLEALKNLKSQAEHDRKNFLFITTKGQRLLIKKIMRRKILLKKENINNIDISYLQSFSSEIKAIFFKINDAFNNKHNYVKLSLREVNLYNKIFKNKIRKALIFPHDPLNDSLNELKEILKMNFHSERSERLADYKIELEELSILFKKELTSMEKKWLKMIIKDVDRELLLCKADTISINISDINNSNYFEAFNDINTNYQLTSSEQKAFSDIKLAVETASKEKKESIQVTSKEQKTFLRKIMRRTGIIFEDKFINEEKIKSENQEIQTLFNKAKKALNNDQIIKLSQREIELFCQKIKILY